MAILTVLTSVWAALAALATADISYPATIEIDILFPRNETYNSNFTGMPVVFAVQNVEAAYAYEWSIRWGIYSTRSSSNTPATGRITRSQFEDNEFQYYFNNVAVVPVMNKYAVSFRKGNFRLEWDYATTPCIPEGETAVSSQTRTPIASGTSYFSVVEDGSGLDFNIPIDDCPSFGDAWSVESDDDCPAENTKSDNAHRDPCAARLTSPDQVACIWEYLTTNKNETETCLSSFKRADPDWPMYYTPSYGGDNNEVDSGDRSDDDDNADSEDGGSSSDESDTSTSSGDNKNAGVSHRPGLSGLAFAVFSAVVMSL